ncbi:DUF7373 family lipoprotein [Nocardia crassostreae]|uniref:DUF7373 family lipoprotein n=1 Tax=Nocardia crassostreae TaxID=53428 RepID=UPI000832B7DD|nr:hypothetical protein [Nocardia crassostreae]
MSLRTHRSVVLFLLTPVVIAAGCAVPGTPVAGEADVRGLDVGTYEVDRHAYDQDSLGAGALLEGIQMSEALPTGPTIDSSLIVGRGGYVVMDAKAAEENYLAYGSAAVLSRHQMITAYGMDTADADDPPDEPSPTTTTISDLLMRFDTEATAKLAACELEDVDFSFAADQNKRLNLAEFPDAYIHWRPSIASIGVFVAHKEFVVSLYIQRPSADSADLLNWVRKSLTAQVARLDSFAATPQDKLDGLKVDPDNMLARMVAADRGDRTPDANTFAVYGPSSYIHNAYEQAFATRQLTDAGVDRIAVLDDSYLHRARDTAAATGLLEGFVGELPSEYNGIPAPKSVPGAKCFLYSGTDTIESSYRCYVTYKRYLAVIRSDTETDVLQKAAAQYALLANSL